MAARQELIQAIHERYERASRGAKQKILDELVALTGYHRKHAIRVLTKRRPQRGPARLRNRIYNEAVHQALIVLWEASDRLCGKRLKPLIPILIDAMSRHGHLHLDGEVQRLVLTASAATIDRLLRGTRTAARGDRRRQTRMSTAIRKAVPVRTFADWNDPAPGYFEADFVAHCGGTMSGRFVHSLVMTDIASGWTECLPVLVREQTVVVEALSAIRSMLPFPCHGVDTDNDSAFLNQTFIDYCRETGVEFTRSRAYHKNDQAWIEQKNGAIVRRLVGYGRIEGVEGTQALQRLYEASRLYVNFFQPSFKLKSKTREGARIIKKYHSPKTPYERLLDSRYVSDEIKEQLQGQFSALDPMRLLEEIRSAQQALVNLVSGERCATNDVDHATLHNFLINLSTAWREGEVRPTHRQKPRAPRTWRTRLDPFQEVWPEVKAWLRSDPAVPAKELFHRLQARYPNKFPDNQLRTLQRRVAVWRSDIAHNLVFASRNAVALHTLHGEHQTTTTLE
jgi:hypothetical protein